MPGIFSRILQHPALLSCLFALLTDLRPFLHPSALPRPATSQEFAFEHYDLTTEELKELIWLEALDFNPEARRVGWLPSELQ